MAISNSTVRDIRMASLNSDLIGLRRDASLELCLTERRNGDHVRRGCGVYSIPEHGYWGLKQFGLQSSQGGRGRWLVSLSSLTSCIRIATVI